MKELRHEDMKHENGMTYDEWEKQVPSLIRGDTLWRVEAYRLGLSV